VTATHMYTPVIAEGQMALKRAFGFLLCC